MLNSLLSIFKREKSGKVAKKRLQMVLIQDRASVSPEVMEKLRDDIIKVISKYMEIDVEGLDIQITQTDGSDGEKSGIPALVANIPIKEVKHNS